MDILVFPKSTAAVCDQETHASRLGEKYSKISTQEILVKVHVQAHTLVNAHA